MYEALSSRPHPAGPTCSVWYICAMQVRYICALQVLQVRYICALQVLQVRYICALQLQVRPSAATNELGTKGTHTNLRAFA